MSRAAARCVEWEELPPSVREVPEDFNPLAKGVLMAHQVAWLALHARIKVAKKGRRTGITFAEALDSTLLAATSREDGGDNVYYIGDTKAKGLEFIGYCARFARTIAQAQGDGVGTIEEFLFEDQDDTGRTRYITSYRIRFASGFQIVALSSNPANIRGLQGKVIIDEAAFHRDVQAVLDAATALLIWGGRVVIISTHNGKGNAFNTLVRDIEEGRYGDQAQVMTITFDDAVANGLYERVCLIKGEKATAKGKRVWYISIRALYGPRKAQMREELDVIPRDGNGVCLPGVWIDAAMTLTEPVLRLALPDSFAQQSNAERKAYVEDWIKRYLAPALARLPKGRPAVGQDFARHRDFSVIVVMIVLASLQRAVPLVIEMHNVPTRQQEQILWFVLRALDPRYTAALDAGGNGATLAEYTADEFGHARIAQVQLSRAWYGTWMGKMIQWFEDSSIALIKDDNLAQDLRTIQDVDGVPMVAPLRRKDLKDPDLQRHGDFAVALALAVFASLDRYAGPVKVVSRRRRVTASLLKGYA